MKTTFVLLLLLGITGFQPLHGQEIIAGQSDGADVVYVDIEDVGLYVNDGLAFEHDAFPLDVDQDGNADLTFSVIHFYYSHPDILGTQTYVEPDAYSFISKLDSTEYAIKKHEAGETIGAGLNWFPQGMAILNSYTNESSTVNFINEGYVGFRICRTDTVYGWVRVLASASFMTAQLTILDYAYLARPNAIEPAEGGQQVSCTLFDNNQLCVETPNDNSFGYLECRVIDFTGRLLKEVRLTTGRNYLSLSDLRSGVYLVTIQPESGIRQTFKILKP